jgi:uncharacterized membrane protein
MVSQIIVCALTWLHVISVIGWFGAVLTFLVAIRPSLAKLSPQANSEFVLKVFPRFVRTVQIFTVLTVVFGLLLALAMSDGPPNVFNLVSAWSIFVALGAVVGIFMLFVVFLLFAQKAKKLESLILHMQQNPQQHPPVELRKVQKQLAILLPLGAILLLLAEAFMVTAAQF